MNTLNKSVDFKKVCTLNFIIVYLKDILWDKHKVDTTKPYLRKHKEDIDEVSKK